LKKNALNLTTNIISFPKKETNHYSGFRIQELGLRAAGYGKYTDPRPNTSEKPRKLHEANIQPIRSNLRSLQSS